MKTDLTTSPKEVGLASYLPLKALFLPFHLRLTVFLLIFAYPITAVQAQNWAEIIKKTAPDAADFDSFGASVAISGDYAIVGASIKNTGQGAVYIFKRNTGGTDNWGFLKKITASTPEDNDKFGISVALSGDYAMVGAVHEINNNQGAVYVYKKDLGGADNWGLLKSLAVTLADYDNFGYSIALSGDYALIGAYGDNVFQGAAYFFKKDQGGTDNWGQVQKITASDGISDDYFGAAAALSGNYAIVGAYAKNNNKGSAYIFKNDGSDNWSEIKILNASDGADGDFFGTGVGISQGSAIVGAYSKNNYQGAAYVFNQTQGGPDNWGESQILIPSDIEDEDLFGSGIAMVGNKAIIGSTNKTLAKGAAYYFKKDGTGTWTQAQKLSASDGADFDNFGYSISLSENYAIIGAIAHNNNQGAAYVFQDCPTLNSVNPADYHVCSGDNTSDINVSTARNDLNIKLVYFTSAQTGTSMYSGGTVIGASIVPAGANAPYTATFNNLVFPANTTTAPITYFVYGILDTADPDLTDISCRPFAGFEVTVDPPAILDAGPNQTICAGSTVQLAAVLSGAATSGVWSLHPNHGTWSPSDTDPNAIYTPSAAEVMAGTATLTYNTNDPAGVCPGVSDQVTIFINPAATALAGPDQFVCATSPSVTLAGSFSGSAATATWSGAGTFSPNNTTLNAIYTPSAAEILAGTATLTLTTDDPAGICPAGSDQMTIFIGAAAILDAGPDQVICAGSTVQLAAVLSGAATSGVWSLHPNHGTWSPLDTDPHAIYTPSAAEVMAGTATLTYNTNDPVGACPGVSDQVTITIKPSPTATLSASQTDVCPNTEVTLTPTCSNPAATVQWNPGAPTVTPNAPDLAYVYKAACVLGGCVGNESSVTVRTHRLLADLKEVGTGLQPKAFSGTVKDNLAPTNLINSAVPPRLWTILANGCSASESAVFKLTGPISFNSIDNNPPYALFANVGPAYFAVDHPNYGPGLSGFPNGTYTLTVELRGSDGVGGPFPKNRVAVGALLATRTLQFTLQGAGGRLGVEENNEFAADADPWALIVPNPVVRQIGLEVRSLKDKPVQIHLSDVSGRALLQRSFVPLSQQHREELEAGHLKEGIYFLQVVTPDKTVTMKVVKVQ
ncbi:MAG: T9SS type A sorting domain-containing protein [Spirosomataceae bacterium]